MIVLIHMSGLIVVGRVDGEGTVNDFMDERTLTVRNPRHLFRQNVAEGEESIILSPMPTAPEFVTVNTSKIDYIYPNNDERFEKYYVEMTTNIKLM